jgi:hypothetical protein
MVVTPSSSQSHPTLHVPSTEPLVPPVLNVRRPKALRTGGTTSHSEDFILATAVDDSPLPPTVLRLPNLAAGSAAADARNYSIASIAHWVAIVLGGLIALWLIFGGRRGEMPDPDAAPLPARAEADSGTPAWVPPPLESAGDSSAPAWTPPKATTAPAAAAPPAIETPAPASTSQMAPEMAPPFDGPAANSPAAEGASEESQQEAWPRPTTPEPVPASTPELAPAGTSAQNIPPGAATGPAVRTAQLEPRVDPAGPSAVVDDPGASEVQPLGITVPVPQ